MSMMWDFECLTCNKRVEQMRDDSVLSIPCDCGGKMIRVMGGRPGGHASGEEECHHHGHFEPLHGVVNTATGMAIAIGRLHAPGDGDD